MVKNIILTALILSLILVGCQKTEKPATTPTQEPAATSESSINIDSDVSGIDSIEKELNAGELDNLEKELDEINW